MKRRLMATEKKGMDWDKLKVFTPRPKPAASPMPANSSVCRNRRCRGRSARSSRNYRSRCSTAMPGADPHRAGRVALPHRPRRVHEARGGARAKLTDSREKPHGELKVTTTPGMGIHWLTPRLGEFMDLFPDIASPDHHRRGARPRHARGRRRDPAAPADPAGPDPAQAVLGALHAYASTEYLKRAARRASWRSSTTTASSSSAARRCRSTCRTAIGSLRCLATAKARGRRAS